MTAEAAFSATVKGPRQELFTLRGDTYDEFAVNVARALGQESGARFLESYSSAFGGDVAAVAVQNVQAVMPGSQVVSTVGQALPQPGAYQQPSAPVAPPVANPGPCAHGARLYVDKPARGKPWRRWECAIPWSRDLAPGTRCEPVNV